MARIYGERHDLEDDVRHLIEAVEGGADLLSSSGDCAPPLDVIETATGIEILLDLPGVRPEAVQIVFAHNTLVIAGRKTPAACEHAEAGFHLAERRFGRFLRAIRLSGAWNPSAADARLSCGELRVMVPRIEDRRGRGIRIPVRAD